MSRPVVFVLDRDAKSLDALLADLAQRFGNDFSVTGNCSPDAALDELQAMATANEAVALVLAEDDASDFLPRAHELHPRAKRVLLVDRDYSSASPAVQATALGRADYHIVRPWTGHEMMYGAMSEFLGSWTREQEPDFELFRIVGAERDGSASQVRDAMTRFGIPFGFYAAESKAGWRLLDEAGLDDRRLPVVIRYDGQILIDPSLGDLARAIGVNVKNDVDTCELAIVGAGPAGLTAAVHGASEGLDTVLLEQAVSGGQAGTSPLIRNYPGFPHGVSGGTLMEQTCEQAWLMGAHMVFAQRAVSLEPQGDHRVVRLLDGTELRARAAVVATGMEWRRLGVPRLEALVGSGVYYGAAVGESRAMEGQDVFIVGAGNSAGQAALHLARHARTVTLVVRSDSFAASMSNYLARGVESAANISVRRSTEVVDGGGNGRLEHLTLADKRRRTVDEVPAAALFVMIGGEPHTQWLPREIARDENGYLVTGRQLLDRPDTDWGLGRDPLPLESSISGVFAAGDVRQGSIKRLASAVGEGATAVRLVHEYLGPDEPAVAFRSIPSTEANKGGTITAR